MDSLEFISVLNNIGSRLTGSRDYFTKCKIIVPPLLLKYARLFPCSNSASKCNLHTVSMGSRRNCMYLSINSFHLVLSVGRGAFNTTVIDTLHSVNSWLSVTYAVPTEHLLRTQSNHQESISKLRSNRWMIEDRAKKSSPMRRVMVRGRNLNCGRLCKIGQFRNIIFHTIYNSIFEE